MPLRKHSFHILRAGKMGVLYLGLPRGLWRKKAEHTAQAALAREHGWKVNETVLAKMNHGLNSGEKMISKQNKLQPLNPNI